MPYPNNLDIYDFDLVIQQSEIYNTAHKKVAFFENRIKEATEHYNLHSSDILQFGLVVILGNREIDTRGQIPDTTHCEYYKEDYEKFIKEIKQAINELQENIEIEKGIQSCENKTTIENKIFAFIGLKKIYKGFLYDIEITLKDANKQAYNRMCNNYSNALIFIEKRISELTEQLNNPVNEKEDKPILSLKANITNNQIERLHKGLENIFDATLEQWQCLFSESIILQKTIIVKNYKSDVKVLFHYLKKKGLIETNKYPSILEKVKAFSFENKILTSKQINATNENYKFPNIGSYIQIASVMSNL